METGQAYHQSLWDQHEIILPFSIPGAAASSKSCHRLRCLVSFFPLRWRKRRGWLKKWISSLRWVCRSYWIITHSLTLFLLFLNHPPRGEHLSCRFIRDTVPYIVPKVFHKDSRRGDVFPQQLPTSVQVLSLERARICFLSNTSISIKTSLLGRRSLTRISFPRLISRSCRGIMLGTILLSPAALQFQVDVPAVVQPGRSSLPCKGAKIAATERWDFKGGVQKVIQATS